MKLIAAVVITDQIEDKNGRVRVESPTVWEESPLLQCLQVVNKGDRVWVLLMENTAIVIAPYRDLEFTNSVLALARCGDKGFYLNKDELVLNGTSNGGLVNINHLKTFIQAVAQDLVVAQSGANVAGWISENYSSLEDKTVKH